MLVEVSGHAGSGDLSLVHPDVVALGSGGLLQRPDGRFGEGCELHRLVVAEIDIERHVPVGADEDVAGIVGKEIHHDIAVLAAVDDESLVVVATGRRTERAAVAGVAGGSRPRDVGHPVSVDDGSAGHLVQVAPRGAGESRTVFVTDGTLTGLELRD